MGSEFHFTALPSFICHITLRRGILRPAGRFFFFPANLAERTAFSCGVSAYVLIVTYLSSPEVEEAVLRCLHDRPGHIRSKVVKGGTTELTMELLLKTDNLNVTRPVQDIQGVQDVTLVEYRGNLEA